MRTLYPSRARAGNCAQCHSRSSRSVWRQRVGGNGHLQSAVASESAPGRRRHMEERTEVGGKPLMALETWALLWFQSSR
jgi:hypothetical protein